MKKIIITACVVALVCGHADAWNISTACLFNGNINKGVECYQCSDYEKLTCGEYYGCTVKSNDDYVGRYKCILRSWQEACSATDARSCTDGIVANATGRQTSTFVSYNGTACTYGTWGTCGFHYCNEGYCGNSSGCVAIPDNATCAAGSISCNEGYFLNESTCKSCVTETGNSAATSVAGSTAITDCYLPLGATGSDDTGNFEYTANCNYSN